MSALIRQTFKSTAEARWMAEAAGGDEARIEEMLARRAAGEPLQYVLGSWGFRRLELTIDRRVLIPRPETEWVVEAALAELDRDGRGRKTVVDLGTGSGAIAISIATERPGTEVWATDVSVDALEVARSNDQDARIRFLAGDWWSALPRELRGGVDLVVSNPPYVSRAEMPGLDPQVREWEPLLALEAGEQGTEAIELILDGACRWLTRGGSVVVELAPHQACAMMRSARSIGLVDVETRRDLAGRERILRARKQ